MCANRLTEFLNLKINRAEYLDIIVDTVYQKANRVDSFNFLICKHCA